MPRTKTVDLGQLVPDPHNERSESDQEAINRLADSINQHRILQRLLVRPIEDDRYMVVAGHRRRELVTEPRIDLRRRDRGGLPRSPGLRLPTRKRMSSEKVVVLVDGEPLPSGSLRFFDQRKRRPRCTLTYELVVKGRRDDRLVAERRQSDREPHRARVDVLALCQTARSRARTHRSHSAGPQEPEVRPFR